MAEEIEKKKFKVADNRRFDNDGNERDSTLVEVERVLSDSESSATSSTVSKSEEKSSQKVSAKTQPENSSAPTNEDHTENGHGTITFSSFVISLATQALVQMGQMPSPQGTEIPPDPVAAQQTIDLLEIFAAKTKGNLDENEIKLMEQILHSLRLSYVKSMNT